MLGFRLSNTLQSNRQGGGYVTCVAKYSTSNQTSDRQLLTWAWREW